MKWNLIKLLCEYSDDFSSESFKDLVDSIDMKHLFGNRLLDDFIDFIQTFDTFENNVFVNGVPLLRQGDINTPHTRTIPPFDTHSGSIVVGSLNVFVGD